MANKITFQVLADTKNFQSKFKTLNASIKKMGRSASIAFVALGASLAYATKLAKEQQKVMNQTRAVIKSTGEVAGFTADQVFKLGKQLQRTTTFGDETVISATNLLLTFKEIGGNTLPRATKALLDMSVAMNQGLKESAIQLGKALNDPILGLTAMRRVGIQFTKAQEDQIKAMVKMGKVAEAQGLILTELESQFGGSAEAARKGLGSIDALKNSLGDLAENIILSIAPSIERVAGAFTKLSDSVSDDTGLTAIIAKLLIMGIVVSGLVIVYGALSTAFATIGVTGALVIGVLIAAVNALNAVMRRTSTEAENLKQSLTEEDGTFPTIVVAVEGLKLSLENVRAKLEEVGDEGFILGKSIATAMDLGIIHVKKFNKITGDVGKKIKKTWKDVWKESTDRFEAGGKIYAKVEKGKVATLSSTLTQAAKLNSKFANAARIVSIGMAIMDTASGVVRAFKDYAWPVSAVIAGLVAAAGAVQIATIASQSFASGTGEIKQDTLANVHSGEMIVPKTFAESLRSGEVSLSGNKGNNEEDKGVTIVNDFSNTTFNGVTDSLIEDIFTKASENIFNNTLAFQGVA